MLEHIRVLSRDAAHRKSSLSVEQRLVHVQTYPYTLDPANRGHCQIDAFVMDDGSPIGPRGFLSQTQCDLNRGNSAPNDAHLFCLRIAIEVWREHVLNPSIRPLRPMGNMGLLTCTNRQHQFTGMDFQLSRSLDLDAMLCHQALDYSILDVALVKFEALYHGIATALKRPKDGRAYGGAKDPNIRFVGLYIAEEIRAQYPNDARTVI